MARPVTTTSPTTEQALRDQDILRVAGALLGALWVSTPFKAGPQWEARCELALDEAERLVKAYDRRLRQ